MVCCVWCGGALIFSVSLFYAKKSVIYKAAVGVLCSFPLIPLYYNYSEIDQSKNNHAEDDGYNPDRVLVLNIWHDHTICI